MARRSKQRMTKKDIKKIVDQQLIKRSEVKYKTETNSLLTAQVALGTPEWANNGSGDSLSLRTIDQGVEADQRIGDEITLVSSTLKMVEHSGNLSYRLLIVYLDEEDGSEFDSVLDTYGDIGDMTGFLPRKNQYAMKYRVLYNRIHKCVLSEDLVKTRNIKLKVKGLKVEYDPTLNTIQRGGIRIFVLTDTAANGGVFAGDLHFFSKTVYTDM